MAILYFLGFVAAVWVGAAICGFGKNEVFNHPERMSDAQLERTIRLTQRIMDGTTMMTPAYAEASKKWGAAADELTRRYGVPIAPRR